MMYPGADLMKSAQVAALTKAQRLAGIITLSAGNAGQAYAWAGREAGVPTVVVMPAGAVRSKVEACLGYGAEVILHGDHVGDTFARMEAIRDERRLTADEIALIQAWIKDGMTEGSTAEKPEPPKFASGWMLGEPDLVVEMPAAYHVPAEGPDITATSRLLWVLMRSSKRCSRLRFD